jgi:preprotein translocase subunit Sss1
MFASLIPALGFTSLLYLILKLGLIGFIVYLITTYIPMNDIIKKVI